MFCFKQSAWRRLYPPVTNDQRTLTAPRQAALWPAKYIDVSSALHHLLCILPTDEQDIALGSRGFESTWTKLYYTQRHGRICPSSVRHSVCSAFNSVTRIRLSIVLFFWGGGGGDVAILPCKFCICVFATLWIRVQEVPHSNVTLFVTLTRCLWFSAASPGECQVSAVPC